MKSIASFTILSLALLGLTASSHATLLVNPSGGTDLISALSDPSDGSVMRSLGGTFSLYGSSLSSISVQENGFLSSADGFGLFDDYSVGQLATNVPGSVIEPFYDDFYLDPALGDTLTESLTSSYYAISFSGSGDSDSTNGHESVFQAALIKSATVLMGNALLPGDIVFSYGALNSTIQGSNFTVGVGASSTNATGAFGVATGQLSTTTSFLSNFNPASQALLYRYNPTTGAYVQSLITYRTIATPEPATFAALGLGAVAMLRRRRRG